MPVPYLSHFNLTEEPFSTVPNPRYFFLTPIHATALGKTEFTVEAKKGLAIVVGDTGVGKSTLARLLHQKFLDKGFISVLLTNPSYPTPNSLLRTIIQEYQIPKTSKSYKDNIDIFKLFLYQEAEALFYYSEGTPREACILADNSLLLAFLEEQTKISKQLVEAAAKERLTNIGTPKTRTAKQAEKK